METIAFGLFAKTKMAISLVNSESACICVFSYLKNVKQRMVNLIVLVYISPFDIKLKICYNSPLRSYIIDFGLSA